MWATFVLAVIVLAMLLYLPGTLLARSLALSPLNSICVAPPLSVALYALFGIALGALGVAGISATISVLVAPLLVSVLFLVILPKRGLRYVDEVDCVSRRTDWAILALFLAVSVAVSTIFFLKSLDGPASFSQQSDNADHLAKILEVARDGNYSMLKSTVYSPELVGTASVPATTIGYYPNAFHVAASFLVSILGISAPLAENCTLLVFSSFVYPCGMSALLRELLGNRRSVLVCGAFATASFASFPLGMMYFGPVYPNVTAFCCVPAICLLFIRLFRASTLNKQMLAASALLFFVACVGSVALQPNAVFTAAVFLMPFCCHELYSRLRNSFPNTKSIPILGTVLLIFAFATLWYALYKAPFLQSVVRFEWAATSENPVQGFYNIITLSLRYKVPQLFLALLVFIGLVRALSDEKLRWVGTSFILMCFIYFVGDSFDSEIKHLLTGFWYTDQWRTASSVAIMGVPLATLGMETCSFQLGRAICEPIQRTAEKISIPAAILLGAMAVVIFQPQQYIGSNQDFSAFGKVSDDLMMENTLNDDKPYTTAEREFVKKVNGIVGNDLVINMPFDGSVWSYYEGILNNPYYRAYSISDESAQSKTIRTSLNEIDFNEEARRAVEASGAQYVLQLIPNSFEGEDDLMWSLHGSYSKSSWHGLTANLDDISSLELILEDRGMKLYRINL